MSGASVVAGSARVRAGCLAQVAAWLERKPGAPALVGLSRPPVSFAALFARISALGTALQSAGIEPGDIVAVAMPDGPDFLSALLAVGEVAAAAPMDWQLPPAEYRSRLTLLRARVLILRSDAAGHGAGVARELGIPVLSLEFAPDGALAFGSPPALAERIRPASRECALVLQTSATTGEPKLVPLTHRNLVAMCLGVARCLGLQEQDRYMSIMPLHHILGFSSALAQLMVGGSVACTGFDAQKFAAWITETDPTWYSAGPALHRAILEIVRDDRAPFHRSRLRFVRSGSGAGSVELLNHIEQALRVTVVNGYGLTEVGPATNTPPGLPRKPGSVGRTIGPQIAIMDERGNILEPGAEGEVVMRGDAVMEGYLGAGELNREVLRHGWFHTGDLGRLDSEGDLFITGRIKEMINRGGESISPIEIDQALAEHPGILQAACFSVPHPTLNEDIVAAVVLRPGRRAAESEIRSFVAARLSRSKVPARLWFAESIPLSASGKPLRDALRESFLARAPIRGLPEHSSLQNGNAPSNPERVGAVWMRVLESDFPGPEDNFFGMGGDSLSATRLFALLAQDLQCDVNSLDLGSFQESPTFGRLVELAAEAERRRDDADSAPPSEIRFENVSAVCLQSSGHLPPVFIIPGERSDPWPVRHLARALGPSQPLFALRHELQHPSQFPDFARQFAALISQIRPAGPLVLGGHCYGGVLAYEIALRLTAMSRTGIAVVLLDVEARRYRRISIRHYMRYVPEAARRLLRGEAGRLLAEAGEHLRFLRLRAHQLQAAVRASSTTPPANPPVDSQPAGPSTTAPANPPVDPGVEALHGMTAGGIVLRAYIPRPFRGPVVNVLAARNRASEKVLVDTRKAWRKLAQGPYDQHILPGSHLAVFTAENAPALASFVQLAQKYLLNG